MDSNRNNETMQNSGPHDVLKIEVFHGMISFIDTFPIFNVK